MTTLNALWFGQSNADWRGLAGPWDIASNVRLWNNRNDVDDLLNLGTALVAPDRNAHPLLGSDGANGSNSGFTQMLNILARDTGLAARGLDAVSGVLCARGAQGIASWYAGSARQLQLLRTIAVANAAGFGSAASGPKFDVVGMQLGESDNGMSLATALGRYNAVFRELREEGLLDETTPILICEASDTHPGTNDIMAALIGGYPNRFYIPTRNIATLSDGTHFDDPVGFAQLAAQPLLFHLRNGGLA